MQQLKKDIFQNSMPIQKNFKLVSYDILAFAELSLKLQGISNHLNRNIS